MIDHFKLIAPFYNKVFPLTYSDALIQRAGLPVDGMLLDAGGGTGRVSKAVQSLASKVVLLDASLDMLLQAKGISNIFRINSTSEMIPFRDHQFQVILLIDAFHHVISQEKTLIELWRILIPGGRLIIIEPDYNLFSVKLVALFEKLMLMRSHFRRPENIVTLARKLHRSNVSLIKDHFNAWVIVDKEGD